MAKLSLADKYVQHKGNSWLNLLRRRKVEAPYLRKDYSKKEVSENERLYNSRYDDRKVPGLFESPIKPIYSSPSKTRRPLSLYKVLPYKSEKTDGRITKNQGWKQTAKKDGMLVRLRGLLSRLHPESHNDDFNTLSASAKDLLRIPPDEKNTVSLDDILAPRRNQNDFFRDYDDVDASVQLAKKKLQESRNQESEFEVLVQKQKQEISLLKEKYERQIYISKMDYEAKIQDLYEKIHQLNDVATSRQEVEKERFQLQSSIRRDNESFLVYKRETEKMFEEMKVRLDHKEQQINEKQERLENKEQQLNEKEERLERKSADLRRQEKNLDHHDRQGMNEIDVPISRKQNENFLTDELKRVTNMIDKHDLQTIEFFNTIEKISNKLVSEEAPFSQSEEIHKRLDELSRKLNEGGIRTHDRVGNRLAKYIAYFDDFPNVFARSKNEAREAYNRHKLAEIERSFAKLKQSLEKKMTKRFHSICELQSQIDQMFENEFYYDMECIELSAKVIKLKGERLNAQKTTASTLLDLSNLSRRLKEVRAILSGNE